MIIGVQMLCSGSAVVCHLLCFCCDAALCARLGARQSTPKCHGKRCGVTRPSHVGSHWRQAIHRAPNLVREHWREQLHQHEARADRPVNARHRRVSRNASLAAVARPLFQRCSGCGCAFDVTCDV